MFLVIGLVGLGVLLFTLVFDDLFEQFVPDIPWLSLPVIGAATAAFGLGAFIVDSQTDLPIAAAFAVATGLALGCGAATVVFSKSIMGMATDATPNKGDLVGTLGRVVTEIRPQSIGEVLIALAGQPVKVSARSNSETAIPTGTEVVVVSVQSPTMVTVESAQQFWLETGGLT